jgi:hypothetical protein
MAGRVTKHENYEEGNLGGEGNLRRGFCGEEILWDGNVVKVVKKGLSEMDYRQDFV